MRRLISGCAKEQTNRMEGLWQDHLPVSDRESSCFETQFNSLPEGPVQFLNLAIPLRVVRCCSACCNTFTLQEIFYIFWHKCWFWPLYGKICMQLCFHLLLLKSISKFQLYNVFVHCYQGQHMFAALSWEHFPQAECQQALCCHGKALPW